MKALALFFLIISAVGAHAEDGDRHDLDLAKGQEKGVQKPQPKADPFFKQDLDVIVKHFGAGKNREKELRDLQLSFKYLSTLENKVKLSAAEKTKAATEIDIVGKQARDWLYYGTPDLANEDLNLRSRVRRLTDLEKQFATLEANVGQAIIAAARRGDTATVNRLILRRNTYRFLLEVIKGALVGEGRTRPNAANQVYREIRDAARRLYMGPPPAAPVAPVAPPALPKGPPVAPPMPKGPPVAPPMPPVGPPAPLPKGPVAPPMPPVGPPPAMPKGGAGPVVPPMPPVGPPAPPAVRPMEARPGMTVEQSLEQWENFLRRLFPRRMPPVDDKE